ncbi:MAG: hypothetical protein AVDCRST_MAG74-184 [uncultured Pyrinomonadaceae bacterium]|uniref:Uncharacterized protein n=1 Tax=uncultured Pyrinomonadaceae bacterium TaxID=2283094 RepID=A0A6J4N963_9BACT|nr:MAG: hypothetical protein AVDCRST_MAG74-184 [uncultured Pyrinomonadaceae bacterium]
MFFYENSKQTDIFQICGSVGAIKFYGFKKVEASDLTATQAEIAAVARFLV